MEEAEEINDEAAQREPTYHLLAPSNSIDVAWEGLRLNDWIRVSYGKFSKTIKDENDLDGIVDYSELNSYNGFIDVDDEAYKERMCELLGMTYKTPSSILIERVEVTRYTIIPRECYTKGRILQIDELPRTSTNVATIRAELMKEMDIGGSVQRET
nr:hypothetical protein [Tanacetum cinerariifolium]